MKTVYSEIMKVGQDVLDLLSDSGFLKPEFFAHKLIYECYLRYIEAGTAKADAVTFTGEDFSISDRNVYFIIGKFKKQIQ